MKIEFDSGYIAGVRYNRTKRAFRREDGTYVPGCAALFRVSEPTRTVTVWYGSTEWTIQEFDDGSRRIIVVNTNGVPLSVYPVHQAERLEDVRGIPPRVLEEAEARHIARVRRGPLLEADRYLLAEVNRGPKPGHVLEVWASGSNAELRPELAVFADGSAIRGCHIYEHWRDAVDLLYGTIDIELISQRGEELAQCIASYLGVGVSA
ncbi:MAG: hypothetical protein KatS3mg015_2847 [Fimbriimonadales bacterium]|nr:MAG: hypothetical protein KatS3mg015_2847 [Fimbriimonadales bacterium]